MASEQTGEHRDVVFRRWSAEKDCEADVLSRHPGNARRTALVPEIRTWWEMTVRLGPKLDYRPPVRLEQATERREREAANISRVSLDALDEGCRATLDREGSGLVERFTGVDVRLNLGVARAPEV